MDILMLGHSGAGKTTYMAALYAIMKDGLGGYSINCNFSEYFSHNGDKYPESFKALCDSFIAQRKDLETIARNIKKGKYPASTMVKQEYYFNLVREKNSIPFNWFDYRGGALMEYSNQSGEARLLKEKILKCDALIVFLDAEVLMSDLRKNIMQYKRLISLVKMAMCEIKPMEGQYFPISFVVTKGDLFPSEDILSSLGLKYFNDNLFSDIINSKAVIGMLTVATITRKHIYNVYFPLFFSVFYGLHLYYQKILDEYNKEKESRSIWDDIVEYFTDEKKDKLLKKVDELQEYQNSLGKILDKYKGDSLYIF